jgi:hypothetical protein
MLFAQIMRAEMHQWRSGDVRLAAMHSGRVRKFQTNVIAVLTPASVKGGAAGSGRSGRATPTIARTRHGHSVRGRKIIANTGASTGAFTRNTANATVMLPGSGNAIGGAAPRWPRSLQDGRVNGGITRTVRHLSAGSGGRREVCKDGRVPRGNHFGFNAIRSTRGRRRKFAKRGRDRGRWGSADSVAA